MKQGSLNRAGRIAPRSIGAPDLRVAAPIASQSNADERWPAVADALARLHAAGRYSLRIVDADCGTGDLLLRAVRYARALGFTAIEARGIDDVPSLVEQGRSTAASLHDPAIGICFETQDLATTLAEEAEFPADIILWCGEPGCRTRVARAIAAAGSIVIGGSGCPRTLVRDVAA